MAHDEPQWDLARRACAMLIDRLNGSHAGPAREETIPSRLLVLESA